MKYPDFDKAFAPTPDIVRLSMEAAFRKGEKAMKIKHKITAVLSAAAVLLVVCAAAVFALPNESQPDVVSQPVLAEPAEDPTVYYTQKGVYYHSIEDCSGMKNAQPHPLTEAQADGKLACPVCIQSTAATDATAAPYGASTVLSESGQVALLESRPLPTEQAYDANPTPTPSPLPMPADENAAIQAEPVEEQIAYYTENGTYYHFYMHCSGMRNAKGHTLSEAEAAGKLACPVCVQGEVETDWFANETLAADGVPQPADHMCAIGQEYFMEIFDHGLFATFPHVDMEGSGKQTDDYIWEEAVYTNDSSLYLAVYREMNKDTLMSGRIALMFPEDFDHDLFSSEGAQWYRNTYALAMETLENLPMNSRIDKLSSTFTQVYVWFDGELRPNVCEMEFETDSGFFSLSFDIDGDNVSLAYMNYNVTRS